MTKQELIEKWENKLIERKARMEKMLIVLKRTELIDAEIGINTIRQFIDDLENMED